MLYWRGLAVDHLILLFCILRVLFVYQVLLYGLESVSDNSVLCSVQLCWYRILLRVFKVLSVDNIALVCYYAGILPPAFAVDLRKLRYYSKLYRVDYTWTVQMQTLLGTVCTLQTVTLYSCCSYHIRCISMFLTRH